METINYPDIAKKYLNDIFTIYIYHLISIVLIIYFLNIKLGIIFTVLCMLIYLLNMHENKYLLNKEELMNKEMENDTKKVEEYKKCRPATMNNPYANYLIGENKEISACTDENNIKKADLYNSFNVYQNSDQITIGSIGKLYRDFYTNTNTKIINNTNQFAKWLYDGQNRSCKIDGNCLQYDDVRYHSR